MAAWPVRCTGFVHKKELTVFQGIYVTVLFYFSIAILGSCIDTYSFVYQLIKVASVNSDSSKKFDSIVEFISVIKTVGSEAAEKKLIRLDVLRLFVDDFRSIIDAERNNALSADENNAK
ncbi:hypothetical protein Tco_1009040, partial [Tanacetum coccineum]